MAIENENLGNNSQLNSTDTSSLTSNTGLGTINTQNTSITGETNYKADYTDLSSGVQNIESAVKDVNESINECNKVINDIFTESTFMGPFADYCYGTWNGLSELTVSTNTSLDTSARVLSDNSESYSESDKNVGEKVGSV